MSFFRKNGKKLVLDKSTPRVALVMRSFLDYRIPVFLELSRLLAGELWILYSKEHTPERIQKKLEALLGSRAIGFEGEWSLGYKGDITAEVANSYWRIPYQPGIVKCLWKLSPNIVVGDGFFQWTWQALAYNLLTKEPLVLCYERTKHMERHAQWYRRCYRKAVLKRVSAFAVNGRLSREYIESLGFSPRCITEGQMAADTWGLSDCVESLPKEESQTLRNKFNVDGETRIFLSVGKMIPLKGLEYLLRGWKDYKQRQENKDVLLLIGEGIQSKALEEFCVNNKVSDVHFLGPVSYDEIYRYYAIADWFVISTLQDNWSLVVPEAMACGLPILCSKYNGCWPELIQEDKNGWVFDPLDPDDTVAALMRAEAAENAQEMGEISRQIVSGHTPERAASAIKQACEIALENKRMAQE